MKSSGVKFMKILSENPKIKIYNDDCLNVLKNMPDKSVDLLIRKGVKEFEKI